jgi:hypothetical protein
VLSLFQMNSKTLQSKMTSWWKEWQQTHTHKQVNMNLNWPKIQFNISMAFNQKNNKLFKNMKIMKIILNKWTLIKKLDLLEMSNPTNKKMILPIQTQCSKIQQQLFHQKKKNNNKTTITKILFTEGPYTKETCKVIIITMEITILEN